MCNLNINAVAFVTVGMLVVTWQGQPVGESQTAGAQLGDLGQQRAGGRSRYAEGGDDRGDTDRDSEGRHHGTSFRVRNPWRWLCWPGAGRLHYRDRGHRAMSLDGSRTGTDDEVPAAGSG